MKEVADPAYNRNYDACRSANRFNRDGQTAPRSTKPRSPATERGFHFGQALQSHPCLQAAPQAPGRPTAWLPQQVGEGHQAHEEANSSTTSTTSVRLRQPQESRRASLQAMPAPA